MTTIGVLRDPSCTSCMDGGTSIKRRKDIIRMKKKRLKGRFTDDDPEQPRTASEREEREEEEIELLLSDDCT